ncbi:MAG: hypothetical protein KF853_10425 [Rhodocyclaceae bacterium]|nr:hypothetical protein [Rhodocyclaceae bacterium]
MAQNDSVMGLSDDDELVLKIINAVVEKLAKAWMEKPWYWPQEIDIQAELRGRLDAALTLGGLNLATWMNEEVCWVEPRVVCEPVWEDGNLKPDVVVWGDKLDPEKPDNSVPALWACEIKYDTQESKEQKDIEKLQKMFVKGYMRFGCALVFKDGNNPDRKLGKPEPIFQYPKLEKLVVIARRNCSTVG